MLHIHRLNMGKISPHNKNVPNEVAKLRYFVIIEVSKP